MSNNFDTSIQELFDEMLKAEETANGHVRLATQHTDSAKVAAAYANECKMHIVSLMAENGVRKTYTVNHEIARRKSRKLIIYDQGVLPLEYYIQTPPPKPVPDKVLMKKMLDDGHPIPGVKVEPSEYLVITAK